MHRPRLELWAASVRCPWPTNPGSTNRPNGPAFEILFDDRWFPGELRAWSPRHDGGWRANMQYRTKPGWTYLTTAGPTARASSKRDQRPARPSRRRSVQVTQPILPGNARCRRLPMAATVACDSRSPAAGAARPRRPARNSPAAFRRRRADTCPVCSSVAGVVTATRGTAPRSRSSRCHRSGVPHVLWRVSSRAPDGYRGRLRSGSLGSRRGQGPWSRRGRSRGAPVRGRRRSIPLSASAART